MPICTHCRHDTNIDGFGGRCKTCGAIYCRNCWNKKTWCDACQKRL